MEAVLQVVIFNSWYQQMAQSCLKAQCGRLLLFLYYGVLIAGCKTLLNSCFWRTFVSFFNTYFQLMRGFFCSSCWKSLALFISCWIWPRKLFLPTWNHAVILREEIIYFLFLPNKDFKRGAHSARESCRYVLFLCKLFLVHISWWNFCCAIPWTLKWLSVLYSLSSFSTSLTWPTNFSGLSGKCLFPCFFSFELFVGTALHVWQSSRLGAGGSGCSSRPKALYHTSQYSVRLCHQLPAALPCGTEFVWPKQRSFCYHLSSGVFIFFQICLVSWSWKHSSLGLRLQVWLSLWGNQNEKPEEIAGLTEGCCGGRDFANATSDCCNLIWSSCK